MAENKVPMVRDVDEGNDYADHFSVADNVKGIDLKLPAIKIIHPAQMFEMPDGSRVGEFEGLILDWTNQNSWWEKSLNDGGEPGNLPDCYSLDGIKPEESSVKKQSRSCIACPKNKFGSDRRGREGKDCANKRLFHILVNGSTIPYRLRIPASCLKRADKYMTELYDRKIPYQVAGTVFKLAKHSNKGSVESSEVTFTMTGKVDKAAVPTLAALIRKFQPSFRHKAIEEADGPAPDSAAEAEMVLKEAGL